MRGAALVFVGGALGSLARYGLALALPGLWATWTVNIVGSFALGALLGLLRRQPAFPPPTARVPDAHSLRLLLGTGFLGGFTTYSAFAHDVVSLGFVAGPVLGLAAGAFQVAMGLVAALLGFAVADTRRSGRRTA